MISKCSRIQFKLLIVLFFIISTVIYYSCEKLDFEEKPTVVTVKIEDPTLTTVTATGQIDGLDMSEIRSIGFGWSEGSAALFNPEIQGESKTTGINIVDNQFNTIIPDLAPGQKYYLWAFATNDVGTSYGDTISFYTEHKSAIVITSDISNITAASAIGGGNVVDNGGSEITQKGICWNLVGNPTIDDAHTTDGSGTGLFSSSMTDLYPDTIYTARAYAINANGVYYGSQLRFATLSGYPVVTTRALSDITGTSAISGGIVLDDRGFEVTERGVCWSTSIYPTISDSKTVTGSGVGNFDSEMTGLTEWTVYFVRAYATNEIGTSYGETIDLYTNIPLTDFDGNIYPTFKVGDQIWMAKNLRTAHYADGTAMVNGSINGPGVISGDYISKYYFYYDDADDYTDTLGYLYTWAAAMNGALSSSGNPSNVQGACPDGWHLPSDSEWLELDRNLGAYIPDDDYIGWREGDDVGLRMKSHTGWQNGGNGIEWHFYFNALPAGSRSSNDTFSGLGFETYFWTSTENYNTNAWIRALSYSQVGVYRGFKLKSEGFSIRCIQD